ncbi:7551_t:CDS:2 [Funneliformis mosseae]|uniref:7551_t:CDS:1 n=1 Tax=Funneliformis mosseae TaxID=27381 RepID=A0A9N8ZXF0_FUNMO|nr:7551_t:CDS:2 [Funneliformis mosseae]
MRNCDESDIIRKDNSEKKYKEESRRRVDDKSDMIMNQILVEEGNKTDPNHPNNERLIIIKNMSWRSSTTHKFLQDYINRAFNETSKFTRQRNCIYDNEHYIIDNALFRVSD